jgi:hypothetical protein
MNFSLRTVVKVVAAASLFAMVAAAGMADVSAARKGGGVDFCPDGWRPVTSPLNPVLVCLPDTIVIASGQQEAPPEGGCPEGWNQVTPPLNPVLGCLPGNIQRPSLPTLRSGKPDGLCPDGWRPATSPLNPVLGCLPTSFHMPLIPGAGTAGPIPPGGCPAGWIPATPPLNPVLLCLPGNLAPR